MALADYCAFHLYLANAALFLYQVSNQGSIEYSDCAEAGKYFGACLNQVTQRLEDQSDRVSPGLITTILGLLCYNVSPLKFVLASQYRDILQVCRGRWDGTQMHMNALERIMQLRGGFHGLESNALFFTIW